MYDKRRTRTKQILKVMHLLAYIAFIGFMIQAGAMVISYIVSCFNPEGAKNLYQGLNLYSLRKFDFDHYSFHVTFLVILTLLKAYIWFKVIKTLSKLSLTNPFTMEVALQLEAISYILFGTWVIGVLNTLHTSWLLKATGIQYGTEVSGEFIFMAGLVYIISQVFKRGVELQTENELTV